MCRGRSASAASRWIHGLSPSRSNVIMMAHRAPPGHATGSAMGVAPPGEMCARPSPRWAPRAPSPLLHHAHRLALAARDAARRDDDDLRVQAKVTAKAIADPERQATDLGPGGVEAAPLPHQV